MITNKKCFLLLFIALLVLAACSGDETTSETAVENAETQPAATAATVIEPATVAPTDEPAADAPTIEPAPTEAMEAAETEPETAVPEPTATTAEEASPEEVQFNGPYETTYFRGSATAPVTMIDYSDFL